MNVGGKGWMNAAFRMADGSTNATSADATNGRRSLLRCRYWRRRRRRRRRPCMSRVQLYVDLELFTISLVISFHKLIASTDIS